MEQLKVVIKTEEELRAEGWQPNLWGRETPCTKSVVEDGRLKHVGCGTLMWGRVKSYPPYCDSTYEEHYCPNCGNSYGSSL